MRTGDRGRFRPDGMLEVLGRNDRRVKVNGQLVDLSVVEHEVELLPACAKRWCRRCRPTTAAIASSHTLCSTCRRRSNAPPGTRDAPPAVRDPRAFFRVDDCRGRSTARPIASASERALSVCCHSRPPTSRRAGRERAPSPSFRPDPGDRSGSASTMTSSSSAETRSRSSISSPAWPSSSTSSSPRPTCSAARPSRRWRRAAGADRDRGSGGRGVTVVRVNDGTGRPLFSVPGAADTPVQLRPLGRRLADVALPFGFAYRGMDHRVVPDLTVAVIACFNVAALRTVDPTGLYRLFGYSFGGAVALAMAQQLTQAGDEVELLALLEPTPWPTAPWEPDEARQPGDLQRVRARATVLRARGRRESPARAVAVDGRRCDAVPPLLERKDASPGSSCDAGARATRGVHAVPQLGDARVSSVAVPRSHGGAGVAELPGARRRRAALDQLRPLESAGGRRADVAVPGEHLELVREPNVAAVGACARGAPPDRSGLSHPALSVYPALSTVTTPRSTGVASSEPVRTTDDDTAPVPFDTVPDAFRAVVAQHPDRLALQDRERSVTYAEFDRETNRIAHALLALDGTAPVVVVAPLRWHRWPLIIGAVKAGRLVAPLDPRWPMEQWLEVTRRTHGHLVVPDEATKTRLLDHVGRRARRARGDRRHRPRSATTTPIPGSSSIPMSPAFLFFTSGSTGAPRARSSGTRCRRSRSGCSRCSRTTASR